MMFLAGSGCNAQAGGGLTFVTALALSSGRFGGSAFALG